MSVSVQRWNDMIDLLKRNQIIDIFIQNWGDWRFPWKVSPQWDGLKGRWIAGVESGFVNGLDAVIPMVFADVSPLSKERLELGKKEKIKDEDLVDAYVTEDAYLTLTKWRSIGLDSAPTGASLGGDEGVSFSFETVPDYFLALGVGAPPQDVTAAPDVTGEKTGTRLLRACEVILRQDRPGAKSDLQVSDGIDGGTALQWDVRTYEAPNARRRAVLRAEEKYQSAADIDPIDKLLGAYDSGSFDELHIATVYLVSQESAAFFGEPDGTWTAHVANHVFRSVNHATNQPEESLAQDPLRLSTFGLGGGAGDPLVNFMMSQLNDANSAANQWLETTQLEGRFWSV